jgi:hypothetical protein
VIRVAPALDPRDPGPPELPGEPLATPFPWIPVLAGLAVLLLVAGLLVRRAIARRPAAPPPPPPPAPPPSDAAREALALLRGLRAGTNPAADVASAAEALRGYVGARWDVPVVERTSPEILEDPRVRAIEGSERTVLARVLGAGDAVKFGRGSPTAAERDAVLDAAEGFVTRTTPVPVTEVRP